MMRYVLLLTLLFSGFLSISAQTARDRVELTKLLNEFLAGAGRNDASVHDRFWADDLIYTRSTGVRTNKEEIMKGLRGPVPAAKPGDPVTVYTAEDIQVHQYGNAAVVAFRLVITTTRSDGTKTVANNLNTGTFIKRKEKWQAVAWQSTVVPKPQPEAKTNSQNDTNTRPDATTPFRTYSRGAKGGCYFLNTAGKKVYVDHKYCN